MAEAGRVRQLRLVVTAEDYDEALRFYRDVLGMPQEAAFAVEGGRVTILDAGRATLELTDPANAAYIDRVEVGRRVAGHVRVALEVGDSHAATDAAVGKKPGTGSQHFGKERAAWNSQFCFSAFVSGALR